MKARTKRMGIFFLIAFFVTTGFALSSYARQTSKGQKTTQVTGYCCLGGKVFPSVKDDCLKRKGRFFTGKKAAENYCEAQTPGYCCLDGKVLSLKKSDCLKRKGHFFTSKKTAATWCDAQTPGYCCLNGRIFQAIKGDCLKKQGKFFKDKQAAYKVCEPKGWCVLNGGIQLLTQKACKQKQGRYFSKKQEATRFLKAEQRKKLHAKTGLAKATPGGKQKSIRKPSSFKPKQKKAANTREMEKATMRLSSQRSKPSNGAVWPIQIITPRENQVFHSGDTIRGSFRLRKETNAGPIYFALVAGWDPHIPAYARTAVSYTPPVKRSSTGSSRSIIRKFALTIPRDIPHVEDLPHSSDYKIIAWHGSPFRGFRGSSKPLTIRPLVTPREGEINKPATRFSDKGNTRRLTDTQRVSNHLSRKHFPARITRTEPRSVAVGESLIIYGRHFGREEGHVDISLPDASFHCEINEWTDSHVRCTIPTIMQEKMGDVSREAVLWLKPARVEPPDAGTMHMTGPGGSSEGPYDYNGNEGPMYSLIIQPASRSNINDCGAMVFDRRTGGMRRKPNVDLIVTWVDIIRDERGIRIRPWIKNRCTGNVTKNIHVSIGDVVVTFPGIPGKTERTIGYYVNVPSAASYTVTVDSDHQIAESNEANNSCTRSSTGGCR